MSFPPRILSVNSCLPALACFVYQTTCICYFRLIDLYMSPWITLAFYESDGLFTEITGINSKVGVVPHSADSCFTMALRDTHEYIARS